MLRFHELFEVTQIMEREGEAVGMARIAVRARDRVVEQRDTAPPGRLAAQDLARRQDFEHQIHGALAARPGEQRIGDDRRDTAHATRGEHSQRVGGGSGSGVRARALVPEATAGGAHAREQECGSVLGLGGHMRGDLARVTTASKRRGAPSS